MCEKQHEDLLKDILAIEYRIEWLNAREVCVCVNIYMNSCHCVGVCNIL